MACKIPWETLRTGIGDTMDKDLFNKFVRMLSKFQCKSNVAHNASNILGEADDDNIEYGGGKPSFSIITGTVISPRTFSSDFYEAFETTEQYATTNVSLTAGDATVIVHVHGGTTFTYVFQDSGKALEFLKSFDIFKGVEQATHTGKLNVKWKPSPAKANITKMNALRMKAILTMIEHSFCNKKRGISVETLLESSLAVSSFSCDMHIQLKRLNLTQPVKVHYNSGVSSQENDAKIEIRGNTIHGKMNHATTPPTFVPSGAPVWKDGELCYDDCMSDPNWWLWDPTHTTHSPAFYDDWNRHELWKNYDYEDGVGYVCDPYGRSDGHNPFDLGVRELKTMLLDYDIPEAIGVRKKESLCNIAISYGLAERK